MAPKRRNKKGRKGQGAQAAPEKKEEAAAAAVAVAGEPDISEGAAAAAAAAPLVDSGAASLEASGEAFAATPDVSSNEKPVDEMAGPSEQAKEAVPTLIDLAGEVAEGSASAAPTLLVEASHSSGALVGTENEDLMVLEEELRGDQIAVEFGNENLMPIVHDTPTTQAEPSSEVAFESSGMTGGEGLNALVVEGRQGDEPERLPSPSAGKEAEALVATDEIEPAPEAEALVATDEIEPAPILESFAQASSVEPPRSTEEVMIEEPVQEEVQPEASGELLSGRQEDVEVEKKKKKKKKESTEVVEPEVQAFDPSQGPDRFQSSGQQPRQAPQPTAADEDDEEVPSEQSALLGTSQQSKQTESAGGGGCCVLL